MNIIFTYLFCISIFAHSGRTDGDGGHFNRTSGVYHSHDDNSWVFWGIVIGGIILFIIFVNSGKNKKK